jgi:uncharacterized membrane protein
MKAKGGCEIIEKNRSRKIVEKSKERRCVEYLAIGCEVAIAFIIIFKICKRKNVQ